MSHQEVKELAQDLPNSKAGFFSRLHSPFVRPLCAAHSRRLMNTFYKAVYTHTKFSPPARAESKRSFESKKRRHNNIIDMVQKNNFISQILITHGEFPLPGFTETAMLTGTISNPAGAYSPIRCG